MPDTEALTPRSLDSVRVRSVFLAMLKARQLETKLASLYKAGKIVGGVYLGKGQEAVSGALGAALDPNRDVFAPLIRDQAGRTAFGEPLIDCTRTYLGSVRGPMRGRDGNIHRGRPRERIIAMISHLGAEVSVVAGHLIASRLRGELEGRVGATCVGDGATSTGAFHEGINLAAVERLPLVILVANNQFAYSTPNTRQFACDRLMDRARGYGVEGHEVDGTDFLAAVEVVGGAVDRARAGHGPQMVVANLLRLTGHGEHDDARYIPDELRTGPLGRDCVAVAREQIVAAGYAAAAELDQWQADIEEEVQQAIAEAQRDPKPDPWKERWQALSDERGLFGGRSEAAEPTEPAESAP